jgi:hypothetical protein
VRATQPLAEQALLVIGPSVVVWYGCGACLEMEIDAREQAEHKGPQPVKPDRVRRHATVNGERVAA